MSTCTGKNGDQERERERQNGRKERDSLQDLRRLGNESATIG